ncbi:MAG: hypothetical protein JWO94_3036 [Verrucomicrobiaceae bacterium]|nr:hypothetical protein [Verrucomicrobiaceae bacterium]
MGNMPQVIHFPKLGEVRLHQVKAVPPTGQEALRKLVIQVLGWTRDGKWEPVHVMVDASHPLVAALKGGAALELIPEDPDLPRVWISLASRPGRSLLEIRGTGALALRDLPEGVSLDTSWLPP